MEAKQKAIQLVDNFRLNVLDYEGSGMNEYKAKQCALIAVDEMLDFRNKLYINEGSLAHQYLVEIKQEIEKL
jgi:hypothetical protein